MRVVEIPYGANLIDTTAILTDADCRNLKAAGIDGVIRYLPELTLEEIGRAFAAGLGVCLVAHVRVPGWTPTKEMGGADGLRIAQRARDLGIPAGATLWCDLEGMAGSKDATVDYANAWWTSVHAFHFEAGGYIGAGIPLDERELYTRLLFSQYWRSNSDVPHVRTRGYRLIQLTASQEDLKRGYSMVGGVMADRDVAQYDHKGGCPTWIQP